MSRWVEKYELYVWAMRQQSGLLSKSDRKRQQKGEILSKSSCNRQQSGLLSKSACLVLTFWVILCTIDEVSILSKISVDKNENKIWSDLSIVTLQLIYVVRWLLLLTVKSKGVEIKTKTKLYYFRVKSWIKLVDGNRVILVPPNGDEIRLTRSLSFGVRRFRTVQNYKLLLA